MNLQEYNSLIEALTAWKNFEKDFEETENAFITLSGFNKAYKQMAIYLVELDSPLLIKKLIEIIITDIEHKIEGYNASTN